MKKYDPMCAVCASECKQPSTAQLVSCPHFERADKNLDMFDMKGNIRKGLAGRKKPRKKKKDSGE